MKISNHVSRVRNLNLGLKMYVGLGNWDCGFVLTFSFMSSANCAHYICWKPACSWYIFESRTSVSNLSLYCNWRPQIQSQTTSICQNMRNLHLPRLARYRAHTIPQLPSFDRLLDDTPTPAWVQHLLSLRGCSMCLQHKLRHCYSPGYTTDAIPHADAMAD